MKKLLLISSLSVFFLAIVLGIFFAARAQEPAGGTKEEIEVLNKEIAERKDKIKQLEDTISNYRTEISKKQTEAVSLKNQLSILDNRIAQISADIELTRERIKKTELEIKALQLLIADKEKVITRQKTLITSMVQKIHASDQKNYLEIMLTYDDFSDFYNELQSTESIYVDLGRSVHALRIAKDELSIKKAVVVEKKQQYEELKVALEDKKDDMNGQADYKQHLLNETQSSERKFQTLLSSLKQQYQVIENEQRTYEAELRRKLEAEHKLDETSDLLLSWPVPNHHINAYFHDKDYPYKKVFEHSGIDIRAPQGTAVRATASGYVARARTCTTASCYSYILIVHSGNISTVSGHLSKVAVTADQHVERGEIIGYSGGTPNTVGAGPFVTGPHLHFEVRLNGIPVDPMPYMGE